MFFGTQCRPISGSALINPHQRIGIRYRRSLVCIYTRRHPLQICMLRGDYIHRCYRYTDLHMHTLLIFINIINFNRILTTVVGTQYITCKTLTPFNSHMRRCVRYRCKLVCKYTCNTQQQIAKTSIAAKQYHLNICTFITRFIARQHTDARYWRNKEWRNKE